jgi:hypothetical protein
MLSSIPGFMRLQALAGDGETLDSQMAKIPLLAKLKRYDPLEYNFAVWESHQA